MLKILIMKILIIGFGYVGKATNILANSHDEFMIFDKIPELCSHPHLSFNDIVKLSDLIFICLPTPLDIHGMLNTDIIYEMIKSINHQYIIIRSTVSVNFCIASVFLSPFSPIIACTNAFS